MPDPASWLSSSRRARFSVCKFFRDGEVIWQLTLNSLSSHGNSFGIKLAVEAFRVERSNPKERQIAALRLRETRRALRNRVRQFDAGQSDQERSLAHYTRMRNQAILEGRW